MKTLLAALTVALIPTVSLAETEPQKLVAADLQDIGLFISGNIEGCGMTDVETLTNEVSVLGTMYLMLEETDMNEETVKVIVQSELMLGASVGSEFIRENGCFAFNSLIIKNRYNMNTVDDALTLYQPSRGI